MTALRRRFPLLLVRLPEAARQGLRQLALHRLRTGLALSGIVVGVGAVTATLVLLEGVDRMLRESLERFLGGERVGIVRGMSEARRAGRVARLEKTFGITPEDRDALAALPEVEIACATSFALAPVASARSRVEGVRVQGIEPSFHAVRRFPLLHGRLLAPDDERGRRRVALLFQALARDLFGRADAVGEEVLVGGQRFEVVGILGDIGAGGGEAWRLAYLPYSTAVARLGRKSADTALWVRVREGRRFADAAPGLVEALVRRNRGSRAENFRTVATGRVQDESTGEVRAWGRVIGAVALLCLAAGTVGILNVMLVSVTERTREVGLRVALGATPRGVFGQFLLEAALIALAGGLLGLAAGVGFAALLGGSVRQGFTGIAVDTSLFTVLPTPSSLLAGSALALLAALAAGLYPAWRASRLDPIEALRHE